LLPSRH